MIRRIFTIPTPRCIKNITSLLLDYTKISPLMPPSSTTAIINIKELRSELVMSDENFLNQNKKNLMLLLFL